MSRITRAVGSIFRRRQPQSAGRLGEAGVAAIRAQARVWVRCYHRFRAATLILDEVDLILHPLKSELNWPLGVKRPLDFSTSPLGEGLR